MNGTGKLPALILERVVKDAGRGDDCANPLRVFRQGQGDQGDRARSRGVAEHGQEGSAIGSDVIRV